MRLRMNGMNIVQVVQIIFSVSIITPTLYSI